MLVNPIYAEAGITGFESPAAEYQELSLKLDDLLIEHPSATFIGRACGDSMREVGIFDGDLLICDREVEARNLDVVVAFFNGAYCCKLLDRRRRLLLSANPQHSPVSIQEHDTFTIEGIVTKSIRLHRDSPMLKRW
ncbi:translesion error-prone DNA polymerase V autoproteolytic subunit [Vibrio fluvialis]|uniref:translesion error-prone DNA polymerase V autoproteolytic subunit n=1 Tax=Vibrio fluvialis TaxID=676 RepID=UPI001EEAEAEB|nr:translesion error-prone DNA polymerase V autoproteolytic subunit [Vibrio fluvialis]MCG6391785.1 translesion error-prone DNA polymerase V autoproteolytic subunit [Vibrio fluvialis]